MALDQAELDLLTKAAADAKSAQTTAVEARVAARNAVRALDDQREQITALATEVSQVLEGLKGVVDGHQMLVGATDRIESALQGVVLIAVQRVDGGPVKQ